jgi:hypothetical protein
MKELAHELSSKFASDSVGVSLLSISIKKLKIDFGGKKFEACCGITTTLGVLI